jgi:hypothetical protein
MRLDVVVKITRESRERSREEPSAYDTTTVKVTVVGTRMGADAAGSAAVVSVVLEAVTVMRAAAAMSRLMCAKPSPSNTADPPPAQLLSK